MYAYTCTIYTSMYTVVIYVENFRNLHRHVRKLPVRLCASKCSWKAKITTADTTSSWSVIVMGEAQGHLEIPWTSCMVSYLMVYYVDLCCGLPIVPGCTRYGIERTTCAGSAAGAKQRRYFGPNKEVMPARRKLSLGAPRALRTALRSTPTLWPLYLWSNQELGMLNAMPMKSIETRPGCWLFICHWNYSQHHWLQFGHQSRVDLLILADDCLQCSSGRRFHPQKHDRQINPPGMEIKELSLQPSTSFICFPEITLHEHLHTGCNMWCVNVHRSLGCAWTHVPTVELWVRKHRKNEHYLTIINLWSFNTPCLIILCTMMRRTC